MATFEQAIGTILKHEGGYVNNPLDPGGATNFGVSLRWLKQNSDHYLHEFDFDHDGDVDANDIKKMTATDAMNIYRGFWWDKFKYSLIAPQLIGTKVFDMAVNMGAVQAHKLVQRAANALGVRIADDGVLGAASFAAINYYANPMKLHDKICDQQEAFYKSLVVHNPKLGTFLQGWLNRVHSC